MIFKTSQACSWLIVHHHEQDKNKAIQRTKKYKYSRNISRWESLKTYGQQHRVESIAVLLSVINQCNRACEMEDSWRVQYRHSERTALSKTIIWCIIHTVSMVSLLHPSSSCSISVCLSHSGLLQPPVEAMMKPGSLHHTQLPSCSGITHFNDTFAHSAIQIAFCAMCSLQLQHNKRLFFTPFLKMQLFHVDN